MFLLFGHYAHNLDEVSSKEELDFATAFNLAQDYLAKRGRLGAIYWLVDDKEFRGACKTCHNFIDRLVGNALRSSDSKGHSLMDDDEENYVFIDALVKQTRDPMTLRYQCLNVLLAGRDTTAGTLAWTFRLLARHKNVLERLRNEIKEVVGLGPDAPMPTRDSVKKMPYLFLVLKEVLRLYPSVPLNGREAIKDTILPTGGGPDRKSPIFVKKGQSVGYPVYAMHRRQDFYGEDADEFRPERWEGEELKNLHKYAYLPFNGGPRICLGQDFALLEAGYTVARLVQLYPYITAQDTAAYTKVGDERQNVTLILSSGEGCKVKMSGH